MRNVLFILVVLVNSYNLIGQNTSSAFRKRYVSENSFSKKSIDEVKVNSKYSIWLNVYSPSLHSPSIETWDYGKTLVVSDSLSYRYQTKNRIDHNFVSKASYRLGISKLKFMNKRLIFNYGVGVDLLLFSYNDQFEPLEIKEISKIQLIKSGSVVVKEIVEMTTINPLIIDEFKRQVSVLEYQGQIEHNNLGLYFPIGIQYSLLPKLLVSLHANTFLTLFSQVKGLAFNATYTSLEEVTDNYGLVMNRIFFSGGLRMQYKFYKNFNFELNFNHSINSLFNVNNGYLRSEYYGISTVSMSALGLGLSYEF